MDNKIDDPAILYMDSWIIAVDKPSGLLTIQDGYQLETPHLKKMVEAKYGKVWVVHRLDKETSGVIVFARDDETHKDLNLQFQQRRVKKVYYAFGIGDSDWDQITIDQPLQVNGDRHHRTIIHWQKGKPAATSFHKLMRFQNRILYLKCLPRSGYTHQIRSHLAYSGIWMINDSLYDPWIMNSASNERKPTLPPEYIELSQSLPMRRLGLHAGLIELDHPHTGENLIIESPDPPDFIATIEHLLPFRDP
jgi:RluA family pseudouridine synthase